MTKKVYSIKFFCLSCRLQENFGKFYGEVSVFGTRNDFRHLGRGSVLGVSDFDQTMVIQVKLIENLKLLAFLKKSPLNFLTFLI